VLINSLKSWETRVFSFFSCSTFAFSVLLSWHRFKMCFEIY